MKKSDHTQINQKKSNLVLLLIVVFAFIVAFSLAKYQS
jgi:flagellar basal body-associated protein FliL